MNNSDAAWEKIEKSWQNALRPAGPKFEGYSGALAEPKYIDLSRWPEAIDPSGKVIKLHTRDKLRYRDIVQVNALGRIKSLFDLYDTELGDWEKLAWELIYRHVPGLTITTERPKKKRKAGAPRKRTYLNDEDLIVHIHDLRTERAKGKSIDSVPVTLALKTSIKRHPDKWRSPRGVMSPASAEARYHEAKRRIKGRAEAPLTKLLLPAEIERLQKFVDEYL
jgi:hypothetical protein